MRNEIAVGIGIEVVTALVFASLSYLAGISLSGNSPLKQALKGPIALFAVLMFATMLLLFGLWKRDSSPYYHGINAFSESEKASVRQPDWAFQGPVNHTAVPLPSPSSTPTYTPLPSKSATPTPTNTASPSPSPTTTLANTQTPTPTASPSPTWSPTPIPPVQITYRDQECSKPYHNARITNAFLEIPSEADDPNAAYVTLYGVAYRKDFSKYIVYWSDASDPDESVEDGFPFEFDKAHESPSVLQSRPIGDVTRPSEYRVTLRVLGSSDGQHQECQVTISIR